MSLLLAAMLASPQVLPFIDRAELRSLARREAVRGPGFGQAETLRARAIRGDWGRRSVQVAAVTWAGR